MNEWSIKRKRIFISIIVSTLIIFIGVPIFFIFYEAPTCFDSKQNSDETGVDCGGSCQLICKAQSLPLILKSDPRILKITDNTFEVVAVVQNPNTDGDIYRAGYTFKLYGASSLIPLKVIEGETYVPKNETFIIFEGPFPIVGGVAPGRATLEWQTEGLVWKKNTQHNPELVVKDISLSREETKPRINVDLENLSLSSISNIELIATVSDEKSNILAASKTFVEFINKGESMPVVFTWPDQFKIKFEICESPVDVVLLLDRSGTMRSEGRNPSQPLTAAKNAAQLFTEQLSSYDQVAYISFATNATNPIEQGLSGDLNSIKQVISKTEVGNDGIQYTNIGDALKNAMSELDSTRHKDNASRVIVLLTDGDKTNSIDPNSKNPADYPSQYAIGMATEVKNKNIAFYTIGLGSASKGGFIQDFATTPDYYYRAPTKEDLNTVYKEIGTKICKKKPAVINITSRIFPDNSFIR